MLTRLLLGSGRWLCVQDRSTPAAALVVLSGDRGDRVWRAAELYAEQVAPCVIVSGAGECMLMAQRLRLAGVPANAILIESRATTTWENAQNVSELLRQNQIGSAVIVTSWWHSRRALACFRAVAPEIEFRSVPAWGIGSGRPPRGEKWLTILVEYVKTARYFALGRISRKDWRRMQAAERGVWDETDNANRILLQNYQRGLTAKN